MKWAALICCGVALLAFLFLPYENSQLDFTGHSEKTGFDLLFRNDYEIRLDIIIELGLLIAMIICVLKARPKTAGIICCVGALLPLLGGMFASKQTFGVFSMGFAVIALFLLGGAAATLCFIYGMRGFKIRDREPVRIPTGFRFLKMTNGNKPF